MEYAPADNLYLLAYLNMGLGFVYQISNQVSEAETAFKSSVDYATKLDSQLIRLNSINGLAELYEIQGQLSQAQDTHKQALALATGKSGEQSPVASIAYLGLAKIARERNELDAANEFLDKALSLARLGAFIGLELDAMITRALVRRAGQRWRDAQDALDEAEALVRTSGDMELLQRIGAFASRIWLAQNDRSKAIQWARSNRLTVADPVIEFLEIEYLTLARILSADKENEAVIDLLDRWQPAAEASGRHARLIEMLLLRGLAQFEQGNIQEATLVLGRALKLAAPEGFVRIFADEGPSTVKPLQETIKQFGKQWPLSLVEYSQRLVTIIAGESKTLPTRQEETLLLDPLSEREIQILKLIAAGLSNKEIAGELFLTVGTVKTYTHQLYGKLGVSRRTEAVDKAREKGII
jgi:LuxR family maltose regulon positive regulatory protein